jgi:glucosamine kinase
MDIFIGVDGGGTSCKIRIENAAQKVLGVALGGPANIARHKPSQVWHNIQSAIERVLTPLSLSLSPADHEIHIAFGLAGQGVVTAERQFLAGLPVFKTILSMSDAEAAFAGAHGAADGDVIIVGTGIIGYQKIAGSLHQVNGWGFPHSDEGSGAWLGCEAVRLSLQSMDGRVAKSHFSSAILQHISSQGSSLIEWVNAAGASEFASLVPLIVKLSHEADSSAQRLLQCAAEEVSAIAHVFSTRQTQSCALLGGVAPYLQPWLSAELQSRLMTPKKDAAAGAIELLRQSVMATS